MVETTRSWTVSAAFGAGGQARLEQVLRAGGDEVGLRRDRLDLLGDVGAQRLDVLLDARAGLLGLALEALDLGRATALEALELGLEALAADLQLLLDRVARGRACERKVSTASVIASRATRAAPTCT